MSQANKPTLKLHLTPNCDNAGSIASLTASLTIGGCLLNPGDPICAFTGASGSIDPADVIAERCIRVEDDNGPMKAFAEKSRDRLDIHVQGHVQGDVTIHLDTRPRQTASSLRCENGGLVGTGAFLPRPQASGEYEITVSADTTPPMRLVTSLGEGTLSTTGTETTLQESIFMVGRVQSSSSPAEATSSTTYWLSGLSVPHAIQDYSSNMCVRLVELFGDDEGMHRAFLASNEGTRTCSAGLRSTTAVAMVHDNFNPAGPMAMAKAYNKFNVQLPAALSSAVSGVGHNVPLRSVLVEFDARAEVDLDWALVRALTKNMMRTRTRLDPEDDGTSNECFSEGLANMYTICLPFRFELRTRDYRRATLDAFLTAYFTNPLLGTPVSSVPSDSTTWHAESFLQSHYCIYMICMDCLTRRASVARNTGIERPIDEIVADMGVRRRKGQRVQRRDWLKYMGDWIGYEEARRHLDEVEGGGVLDMDDMKTVFGGIECVDGRVMQMGFDRVSLTEGVVSGVVQGSNADKAGLRDGDEIAWHSTVSECEGNCEKEFTIRVRRNGHVREIRFLPRGEKTVKTWLSVKRDIRQS
ncbi:pdz/dhr/glgf [Metarhizium rileyi]|uniref:Pdz/dhr/glgf n=1 Tax=Metarhizium rileyi (strain RCEF 4871) TaxID=1649241 RepID=A0A166Y9R1_METRR|nr:pdz/dhr/glgf [Metarhizium rileyi RCEF 4871]